MLEWFIGIAILSALAAGWYYTSYLERKRRESLIELTKQLGLELNWQLLDGDLTRFQSFDIAQKGRMPRTDISITADDGETRMLVFDFSYTTGQGKHKRSHLYSMAMCTNEHLQCPKFSLEPASWTSRITELVSSAIIRIEHDPDFSRQFTVRGNNPDAVHRFLNDARIAFLLQFPQQRLEFQSDTLLIIRKYGRLKAENVRSLMSEGLTITKAMCET